VDLAVRGRLPRRACTLALLSVSLALAVGCASKAPKPARASGSIQANTQLNPSVSGRASPVLLRVYELKSATVFNSADFMALFQGDQATLAADVVSREEMMLQPGEVRPYNKMLAPETRYIAVMAAYRNLERATWRHATPVLVGREQDVVIRADELAVSITVKAK
jgi:type VI secretion system protein VasD